jgi:hypothetical protein
MALPSIGGGYQLGDGNQNEAILIDQGDVGAAITATTTLTASQLANNIVLVNPGAAINLTTPNGLQLDDFFGNAHTNSAFDVSISNSSATNAATLLAGAGVSIVGTASVAAAIAGRFRFRKTSDATWIAYRF